MPDYKESTIAGTKWQRACRVVIENPLSGTPSIMFVEEEAINTGGKTITNLVANCGVAFDSADPKHIELYTKLNEIYTILREARDAQLVQPPVV